MVAAVSLKPHGSIKWDYLVVELVERGIDGSAMTSPQAHLDKLGDAGWELVCYARGVGSPNRVIFKRPRVA